MRSSPASPAPDRSRSSTRRAFPVHFACELKDFDPTTWIDRKAARRMDRFVQLVLAAARQAEQDSGVDVAPEPERMGASIATGIGGLNSFQDSYGTLRDRGPDRVSPFSIPTIIPNMGAGWVSIELGTQGPAHGADHRVRGVEHGDRRRARRDPARPRAHDVRRRRRGAGHRDGDRRLRRDARALAPQREPAGRVAAVRRRPRRARDRRGGRGARAGGARARAGARREDLRGARSATASRRTRRTSPSPTRPARARRAR